METLVVFALLASLAYTMIGFSLYKKERFRNGNRETHDRSRNVRLHNESPRIYRLCLSSLGAMLSFSNLVTVTATINN